MALQDFRGQGPPADIDTFQSSDSVLVYEHLFSGTTYTVAARQGERGWVLVAHGTVPSTVIQSAINSVASLADRRVHVKGSFTLAATLTLVAGIHFTFDTFTVSAVGTVAFAYTSAGTGAVDNIELIGGFIWFPENYATSVIQFQDIRFSTVHIDYISSLTGHGTDTSRAIDLQSSTSGTYYNKITVSTITGVYVAIYLTSWAATGNVNNNIFSNTQISMAQFGAYLYNRAGAQAVSGNRFENVWVFVPHSYDGGTKYGFYLANDAGGLHMLNNAFTECEVDDADAATIGLACGANTQTRWIGGRFDTVMTVQVQNAAGFANLVIGNVYGFTTQNSGYSTGTGAQQTIPHGCKFTPTYVQVFLSERITGLAVPKQTAAPDATNIYITATLNKDYNWRVSWNP